MVHCCSLSRSGLLVQPAPPSIQASSAHPGLWRFGDCALWELGAVGSDPGSAGRRVEHRAEQARHFPSSVLFSNPPIHRALKPSSGGSGKRRRRRRWSGGGGGRDPVCHIGMRARQRPGSNESASGPRNHGIPEI